MPSNTVIYRVAATVLWGLVLWHSWVCRGLFVDGSIFLSNIAQREWFFDFYAPRLYAMILGQVPAVLAVKLGVTDLHWLGRLLSFGLFALPTVFYHLALKRAQHDSALLATVLAAIGVVFLSTSFFIVGEYNTLYGMAILVAVILATGQRLDLGDGIWLLLMGILALRTYEGAIYLSPILAPMILWRVWTARSRPFLPALLYICSAAGFMGGFAVALESILVPWDAAHRNSAALTIFNFWQDMQFMLGLAAVLTVGIWALLRPGDLAGPRPYKWAAVWVVLLALSPLLGFGDGQLRPMAKSHYVARTWAGGIIAAMVVAIWIHASAWGQRFAVVQVARTPDASRKLVILGAALVIAVLPSDLYLTATWKRYLDAFVATVHGRSGLIPYEETPLATRPHILLVENWTLPSASLVLRNHRGAGIVLVPKDYTSWSPFNPAETYPDLGRFFWNPNP